MISQVRNCGPRGRPHERRFLLAIVRVPNHGITFHNFGLAINKLSDSFFGSR
jgi:hypothetical protein